MSKNVRLQYQRVVTVDILPFTDWFWKDLKKRQKETLKESDKRK